MTKQKSVLTIGELATACGVSAPTVRYYEQIKLLPAAYRTSSGQRRYDQSTVEKLTFIRRARDFGFSIKQVNQLLDVQTGSKPNCQSSKDIALSRIDDIRTKISDLVELEKTLKGLINTCEQTCGSREDLVCNAFVQMQPPPSTR